VKVSFNFDYRLNFNNKTFRKVDFLPFSGKKGKRTETLADVPPSFARLSPVFSECVRRRNFVTNLLILVFNNRLLSF
jgi:hypothetical protein